MNSKQALVRYLVIAPTSPASQKDDRPNSRLRDYMTDKVPGGGILVVDDTVDGRNPAKTHLFSMKTL